MADDHADDQFVVTVVVDADQAAELIARHGFDAGDHPSFEKIDDRRARLTLFLDRREIDLVNAQGLELEVGMNITARARDRAREIGSGDRFDGGARAPSGLGRKVHRGERGPR